jgi:hypothetical protein
VEREADVVHGLHLADGFHQQQAMGDREVLF